jgi:hypothetical protein
VTIRVAAEGAATPSTRLLPTISRKVDKLSCVRFSSARYSVPNRLIGATVLIAQPG